MALRIRRRSNPPNRWSAKTYEVRVWREEPQQGQNTFDFPVPEMVRVEGGEFMMGDDDIEDASPRHLVRVHSFEIGKYPVTQIEWKQIMENNHSEFKGDNHPAENVSWNECQKFISLLNKRTNMKFRLPTEAEWEYAAGGGANNRTKWAGINDINTLDQYAWYLQNSNLGTQAVGQKKPNQIGLYDMSGNVWEWCQDRYAYDYYQKLHNQYPERAVIDPRGPLESEFRVVKGGSWLFDGDIARVSLRLDHRPYPHDSDVGFRLARDVVGYL